MYCNKRIYCYIIFFLIVLKVFGNAVTAITLSTAASNKAQNISDKNFTFDYSLCGSADCQDDLGTNSTSENHENYFIDTEAWHVTIGILLAINVVAVAILFFSLPVTDYKSMQFVFEDSPNHSSDVPMLKHPPDDAQGQTDEENAMLIKQVSQSKFILVQE